MAHEGLEEGGESLPIHLLQADDVCIVAQDLLHDQRPSVLRYHIPEHTKAELILTSAHGGIQAWKPLIQLTTLMNSQSQHHACSTEQKFVTSSEGAHSLGQ